MRENEMTDGLRVPVAAEMLVREDVERVLGAVGAAVEQFSQGSAASLVRCTPLDRDLLLLRVAVTWLLANGLIVTAPDGAFERMFPVDLADPFAGDVVAKLREYIARRIELDARQ
jgi:hypothetical protein